MAAPNCVETGKHHGIEIRGLDTQRRGCWGRGCHRWTGPLRRAPPIFGISILSVILLTESNRLGMLTASFNLWYVQKTRIGELNVAGCFQPLWLVPRRAAGQPLGIRLRKKREGERFEAGRISHQLLVEGSVGVAFFGEALHVQGRLLTHLFWARVCSNAGIKILFLISI